MDDGRRLRAFSIGWSFATAFDQFYGGHWLASPLDTLVTVTAIVCTLAPDGRLLFTGLAVSHIAVVVTRLPDVSNHLLFAAIVELCFLFSVLAVRRFDARLDRAFVPVGRSALVLLYAVALLHKLNTDFLFNAQQSCAVDLYHSLARELHVLPPLGYDWMKAATVIAVIASEAAIPVLLSVSRASRFGLLWSGLFHAPLIMINPDFTVFVYAADTLFFPPQVFADDRLARPGLVTLFRGMSWPAALGTTVAIAGVFDLSPVAWRRVLSTLLVLIVVVPFFWFIHRILRDRLTDSRRPFALGSLATLQAAPLLVLLGLGLSPYVGLRTDGSFSMFSNLRTEGGTTNHLFMPRWHLFAYEDDLVEVTRTTSLDLERFSRGRRLVFVSFANYLRDAVRRGEDFEVDYLRNGGQMDAVASLKALAPELDRASFVERRLLAFRPVWPDQRCAH